MAISTVKATMQMRRGMEENFDPDQMKAGEWAVSTDTKKVWMCFTPGIVLRMATYEGFEEDMREIQQILEDCQDIQTAVERFEELARQHAEATERISSDSEAWAAGTRGGVPVSEEDEAYHNNSKYWKEQAQGASGVSIMTTEIPGIGKPDGTTITADSDGTMRVIGGGGGGGGTTNYNDLTNKPSIEGIELQGDVSLGDIGALPSDGDTKDNIVTFREAASLSDINSGETHAVLFGKIKKVFSSFGTWAFKSSGTASDVGLENVGNFKAVSTVAGQNLTDFEKQNARDNIGAGSGSTVGIVSDAFSTSKTYDVGEYCIYNNTLHKCKVPVTTAGAWNADNWNAVTVGEELAELNSELEKSTITQEIVIPERTYGAITSNSSRLSTPFVPINNLTPRSAYLIGNEGTATSRFLVSLTQESTGAWSVNIFSTFISSQTAGFTAVICY